MKHLILTDHAWKRVKKRLKREDDVFGLFMMADPYWPTKRWQDQFKLENYTGKAGRGAKYRRFEDIVFVYTEEIDKYIIITVYVDGKP